jgi:hypothetical protein
MSAEINWLRLDTEKAFRKEFAGQTFTGEGARFTIHQDGTLTGMIGESVLVGAWYWQGDLFCRTATLDGEDLGLDCEVIEKSDNQMRYTRQGGAGRSTIVVICE